MSETILDVENLRVTFDTFEGTAEVINGVDMTISRGQKVGLIGETGCGKSVTAKSILGLLSNAREITGTISYKGEDLLSMSEEVFHKKRGSEIALIPQNPMTSLNPTLTIGEQMMNVQKWQGNQRLSLSEWLKDKFTDSPEIYEKSKEMLSQVEISGPERVLSSYPIELSGGMRQRVLIAMALISEPDLLICDEPGTALDVTTENNILALIDELIDRFDTTVIYITHDLAVAKNLCDYVNVMYAGEIVEQAPVGAFFSSPKHPYSKGLLESLPTLSDGIGEGIEGHIPSYVDPPRACRFADRCPHAQEECYDHYPFKRDVNEDQAVACHLYDGQPTEPRHRENKRASKISIEENQ